MSSYAHTAQTDEARKAAILDLVANATDPVTAYKVAKELAILQSEADRLLHELLDATELVRVENAGVFALTSVDAKNVPVSFELPPQ